MDIALTRDVPRSLSRCELTHIAREPIDYDRAVAQHEAYCQHLQALGLEVLRLPADEAFPDCCFVEDAAVVIDELAVIPRLGAESRRGETTALAEVLGRYRTLARMESPATLDGGDVLKLGRRFLVGRTLRTNDAGIAALRKFVSPFGYEVMAIPIERCLHLKSAISALDDETVLYNPDWIDGSQLFPCQRIAVDQQEPGAANVLSVRGSLFSHIEFPRTIDRLRQRGYSVTAIDISEFLKAEAALTCKSVLFRR